MTCKLTAKQFYVRQWDGLWELTGPDGVPWHTSRSREAIRSIKARYNRILALGRLIEVVEQKEGAKQSHEPS